MLGTAPKALLSLSPIPQFKREEGSAPGWLFAAQVSLPQARVSPGGSETPVAPRTKQAALLATPSHSAPAASWVLQTEKGRLQVLRGSPRAEGDSLKGRTPGEDETGSGFLPGPPRRLPESS